MSAHEGENVSRNASKYPACNHNTNGARTAHTDDRLEWMVQLERELEISILCTLMRGDNEGFFLQVSTRGSSGLAIEGGLPGNLLNLATFSERVEFMKSLVLGAIDAYVDCMECKFETPSIRPLHNGGFSSRL